MQPVLIESIDAIKACGVAREESTEALSTSRSALTLIDAHSNVFVNYCRFCSVSLLILRILCSSRADCSFPSNLSLSARRDRDIPKFIANLRYCCEAIWISIVMIKCNGI